jgi:hypothetical protein
MVQSRAGHAPACPALNAAPRSSRSAEATRATRGATPFRSAVFARFVQAAPHTVGVEVLSVDRRTGLLPPGLAQTASIDAIKAQFFDELQNEGLGCVVIARNWQGDAPRRTCRPAQFEKVSGVDVIERFDHRPAKLLARGHDRDFAMRPGAPAIVLSRRQRYACSLL